MIGARAFCILALLGSSHLSAGRHLGAQAVDRVWGRVETRSGEVHEGFLRWGARAASWQDRLWGDRSVAVEDFTTWDDQAQEPRSHRDRVIDFADARLVWKDHLGDLPSRARSGVPFGLMRGLRFRGAAVVEVELRTGEQIVLDVSKERAADAHPLAVDVPGAEVVRLAWEAAERVSFGAAPSGTPGPRGRRLHATVSVPSGDHYAGLLSWGNDGILSGDTLRLFDATPGEPVLLGAVASIARDGDDVRITMGDGSALTAELDPTSAGGSGITISDGRLGEVELAWDRFETLRIRSPADASGYADIVPGRPLRGRVRTRGGAEHTGRIRFAAQDEHSWEALNGRQNGVGFRIVFSNVRHVEPLREERRSISIPGGLSSGRMVETGAGVTLSDGRALQLEGSSDVDRNNPGILVATVESGDPGWLLIRWSDVREVALEAPDGSLAPMTEPDPAGSRSQPQGAPEEVRTRAASAFVDATAASLFRAAQANWRSLDSSVVRYTAVVRQRGAVKIRTPLRDRTVFRVESATRVFWDREREPLLQVLGSSAEYPGKGSDADSLAWSNDLDIATPFDPGGDRLRLGGPNQTDGRPTGRDASRGGPIHPLAPGADSLYRYQSGDTLALSLPDGTELRTVELAVLPRQADPRRIEGTLWIEPESGALARAVYRNAEALDVLEALAEEGQLKRGDLRWVPGLVKPVTVATDLVTIEYSLWDLQVWLPRSMRIEGAMTAGIVKAPVSFDLAYEVESVVLADEIEASSPAETQERRFDSREEALAFLAELVSDANGTSYRSLADVAPTSREGRSRILVPADPSLLATSPHLPPRIGEDAPGFASNDARSRAIESLGELPRASVAESGWSVDWGWGGRDLLRYNRVEGLAMGARARKSIGTPLGSMNLEATGFFGIADGDPKLRVGLERATERRRVELGAYRELRSSQREARPLALGNSLYAAFFGRDDGDYYGATGADLLWSPSETDRQSYRLRLYAERQDPVSSHSDFALFRAFDGDGTFRPSLAADRLQEVGGEVAWSPWWGTDLGVPQIGLRLTGQGAFWRPRDRATTNEYVRVSAASRVTAPFVGEAWRLGVEGAAGTTWGTSPLQRNWFLGGPHSLRGYDVSTLSGTTFARARFEAARNFWNVAALSAFGDVGWAGDRAALDRAQPLWSLGTGVSLLEGLLRLDLSKGLRGPAGRVRLDLYLDAVF